VSERIARPIAEVFEAIADPARMSRYFISRGSGRMTEGARLTWAWDHAGGVEVTVDVKLVDAPRRIMYVWRAAGGRATKVVLALAADGDGATELTASEAPFALTEEAAAQAVGQTQGWTHFSLCLKAYLEHGVDLRSRRVA
jgi:uncharacterized protein YndB with AHSA1/START domain